MSVTRVRAGAAAVTAALAGAHPGRRSSSVAFVDADRGWAAVGPPNESSNAGSDLYVTTDGGLTWRELGPAPFDGPLHPGRTWKELPTDLPEGRIVDLSYASFDQAWAVFATASCPTALGGGGDEPVLVATDDGGLQWQRL